MITNVEDNYLSQLNPQQRDAVLYCDGPQLVIAGAGSGKTRVLTYKIVHLLNLGFKPRNILALTFTNKAADEMRERIRSLVSEEQAAGLWMGTFHSIFAKILRFNAERIGYNGNYTIYDAANSKSLIKVIIKDMGLDDKTYTPTVVQKRISKMKNALILPDAYRNSPALIKEDESFNRERMADIYDIYCHRCRVAGAMDFDDLLVNTNILLRDNPDVLERYQKFFSYILVDEYQDTNFSQHRIITQLSQLNKRLCVVGDDAQSIYSFRGANIANIVNLQKTIPGVKIFKLEQNYRSTQNIINAANSLIAKNQFQIRKTIFSEKEQGNKINVMRCYSDRNEAYEVASAILSMKSRQGSSFSDFAILYRTNAQSRVLEEALSSGGLENKHGSKRRPIPHRIYGGLSFYERKEILDVLAYCRLVINRNDDEALRRVINYPARGIGATTLAKVQHAAIESNVSLWRVISDPHSYQLPVNKGTATKLRSFVNLIEMLVSNEQSGMNAYEAIRHIIEASGIQDDLKKDNSVENITRQQNIQELLVAAHTFVEDQNGENGSGEDRLVNYLTLTSLATDQDTDDEQEPDCVTLMTVHAAKGLEFRNVFIVGVEEDLFPSSMSRETPEGIEEERRLLYVAITRAEENCVITYSNSRFRNGQTQTTHPSRFLGDIDGRYLTVAANPVRDFGNNGFKPFIEHKARARTPWAKPARQEPTSPTVVTRPAPNPLYSAPATPRDANNDSDFTKHVIGELSAGMRIRHSMFGEGEILELNQFNGDDSIVVLFDNSDRKKLLLKYAKFKILD